MSQTISGRTFCGKNRPAFLQAIRNFHGWIAPGIVLGGIMVDWARELIGPEIESDAIVETRHCLPDAVQLLTPCTVGNGWLKVLDWDKFALSLFDRKRLWGYRVWLDLEKTRRFPDLYHWYMRQVDKKDLPLEILLETIFTADRQVLSSRPVHMERFHERVKKGLIEICPGCNEAYPVSQGKKCTACQGGAYYRPAF